MKYEYIFVLVGLYCIAGMACSTLMLSLSKHDKISKNFRMFLYFIIWPIWILLIVVAVSLGTIVGIVKIFRKVEEKK